MRRLLIAIVTALGLAACGASRPSAGPAATEAPTASVPGTDQGGSTPTGSGTAATGTVPPEAAPEGGWSPPCTERVGPVSKAVLSSDGTPRSFGPLAAAPTLDVTLPTLSARPGEPPRSIGRLVNGGALVALTPDAGSAEPASSSVVAVAGVDGAVRWVRCLPHDLVDVWVAPPEQAPANALTLSLRTEGQKPVSEWRLLALDTGRTVPGFAEGAAKAGLDATALADASVIARSTTAVLIAHSTVDAASGVARPDVLVRYLLGTGSFTGVPVGASTGFTATDYELGPGDDVVAIGSGSVAAVFRDGSWRTDDASRLAARPVSVGFALTGQASAGTLQAVDGLGRVLWRNQDVRDPTMEGTTLLVDGAITVVNACGRSAAGGGCDRYEVVGVDTATGAVRWQLPGFRTVAAAADGWVLVTDAGPSSSDDQSAATGYVLLDDRTGTQTDPGQRWAGAGTFARGCCGDVADWVERTGGAVLTGETGHVHVWYPKATAKPPVTVPLL